MCHYLTYFLQKYFIFLMCGCNNLKYSINLLEICELSFTFAT